MSVCQSTRKSSSQGQHACPTVHVMSLTAGIRPSRTSTQASEAQNATVQPHPASHTPLILLDIQYFECNVQPSGCWRGWGALCPMVSAIGNGKSDDRMYLLNSICVDDKEIHSTMYSKFHTLCGAHCLSALMPSASRHHQLSIAAACTCGPSFPPTCGLICPCQHFESARAPLQ